MIIERQDFLFNWYKKMPNWLKWITFIPLSGLISAVLLIPYRLAVALFLQGIPSYVVQSIYSPIIAVYYLLAIYFLSPKANKKIYIILVALRALFLLSFIGAPILSYFGTEMVYDKTFFSEFFGEILTLLASIILYKKLDNIDYLGVKAFFKNTFYGAIFVIVAMLIDIGLEFLSQIPIIGKFFQFIRFWRHNAM